MYTQQRNVFKTSEYVLSSRIFVSYRCSFVKVVLLRSLLAGAGAAVFDPFMAFMEAFMAFMEAFTAFMGCDARCNKFDPKSCL